MGGPKCARGGAALLALSQMPAAEKLEEEVYTEEGVGAIIGVLDSQLAPSRLQRALHIHANPYKVAREPADSL